MLACYSTIAPHRRLQARPIAAIVKPRNRTINTAQPAASLRTAKLCCPAAPTKFEMVESLGNPYWPNGRAALALI
jgi:hypothetical protein